MDLKEAGYSWAQRLDFDFAIVSFKNWYDSLANETTWVSNTDQERKGQKQVPKYTSVDAILANYSLEDTYEEAVHVENLEALIDEAIASQRATF